MTSNMKKMSNYTAMYRTRGVADVDTFNLSDEELDKQMKDLQDKK